MNPKKLFFYVILVIIIVSGFAFADENPLILQEMSWPEVKAYLQTCDMAIIPLGSTEQHGPHLPLGTDWFETMEICRLISAKTKVMVAPVVMAGYSQYHSGFPGTLSLKPETLAQVLFETVEMLIKYGFRRFLFFNCHGGNRQIEASVIHRINQTTEAVALAVGIGSPIQENSVPMAPFDFHAGIEETSMMLYLKSELVHMDKAKKPRLSLSPQMQEIYLLIQKNPQLSLVLDALLATPQETKKQASSRELSDNGIWTMGDPQKARADIGQNEVQKMVDKTVAFILKLKELKSKPASSIK